MYDFLIPNLNFSTIKFHLFYLAMRESEISCKIVFGDPLNYFSHVDTPVMISDMYTLQGFMKWKLEEAHIFFTKVKK